MKLNLTNNEIAFFCLIFEQDLPVIVMESYKKKVDYSKIQEQFDSFYEKFISLNIMTKVGKETLINNGTQKLFTSIFSADTVVSLLNPQQTFCAYYYSKVGITSIMNMGNSFDVQDIKSIDGSLEVIASQLKLKDSECDEISEIVEDAQAIEDILSKKNKDVSEDIKQGIVSMSKILNKKDGEIIMTERINEKGTILTKLVDNDGVVYQSIIYSDKGDLIAFGKNSLKNSIKTILNFRGK